MGTRTGLSWALASAGVTLGAGACLVSVAGLTGGDAGSSCGVDCGVVEAGRPPADAGPESGADAGPSPEGACIPVDTPDAQVDDDAACLADGSTCGPVAVKAPLTLVPWNPPQAVCTAQQLSDFYTECIENNGDNCMAFQGVTANAACQQCLLTFSTDLSYGPIVIYQFPGGAVGVVDVAGCITALDPCQTPCATVIALQLQCVREACLSTCGASEAGADGVLTCLAATGSCPCQQYEQAATTCWQHIVESKSPADKCQFQHGYGPAAQIAAFAMCGGLDAGVADSATDDGPAE